MLNIKKTLTQLLNKNFYKKGEAVTTSYYWDVFGFVTSGGTALNIYLPTHKSIEFVSELSVTAMTISLRNVAGTYIGGNWYNVFTDSGCTVSADVSNNVITLMVVKTGGWGVTNNTPFTGRVRFNGTFS